ncbi:Lrp/AsnC family transcriptional regulator [Streptomyces sp. TRM64462]|uniref:Lrp/AsnC family transcriptional regulator n=1 Tax=Streptomyces sp. TRM64462 TaxID=2741726 RepID=UPI001585EA12|nr:Lrp/AsnC family transcriptional regulator [Streptomyces sp. TRM64462]
MDHVDRALLAQLQLDATQSYAALGKVVGLSAAAAHERVRKLRERGVIRRTTVDVDPAAVGQGVLAYVMVESTSWMGDSAQSFAALPEVLEAHVIAGSASVLVKVRTTTTEQLQDVLRRIYAIDGVSGTQAIVVLETFFERPLSPHEVVAEHVDATAGHVLRQGSRSATGPG